MSECADVGTEPAGVVSALVAELVTVRAEIAALQARETRVLASAQQVGLDRMARSSGSAREREMPLRSLAAELGVAVRDSDRTMQRRMDNALAVTEKYPSVISAWGEGRLDARHVRAITDAGAGITDPHAVAEYAAIAVELCAQETPGRAAPMLRTLANRLHPVPLRERHATATARRGVTVTDLDDGMAELVAVLPATLAHGIKDRLDTLARTAVEAREDRDSGIDARGIGEVRADVFADLLLTALPDPASANQQGGAGIDHIRGVVHVTIPAPALVDGDRTDTGACDLQGHGPVDTDTARILAGNASTWTRVFIHPTTGDILAVDTYRPTEHQRRLLRIRDQHCRFPGCRQPTHRSDLDHTHDHQHGGPTSIHNLAHLCRRHHTLKHHSPWTVKQTGGGTLQWTSPEGRIYTDHPAHTHGVQFEPQRTPQPPPF